MTDLLDHLWQSSLFVAAAGMLTLFFRNNGAGVRFGLWFAASLKFLVPFSFLTALSEILFPPLAPPPIFLTHAMPATQPFTSSLPVRTSLGLAQPAPGHGLLYILLGLWVLGSIAVLTIWMTRWLRLRRYARSATPLSYDAPISVRSSPAQMEPGLVGILRPVLLLPEGIGARLSAAEMRAVLAHELCHWRRRDNLLAAIHMLVEALFWFHPLVWWLSERLVAERERACDEAVLTTGNDPEVYAEGILKICKLYLHSPLPCAAGVSGANLKRRIETIMENRFFRRLDGARKCLLGAAAMLAVAAPLAMGVLTAPYSPAQASAILAGMKAQWAQKPAAPFNPKDFDRFAGIYLMPPIAPLKAWRDGNRYFVRFTGQTYEFFPETGNTFFNRVNLLRLRFDSDLSGHVTQAVVLLNGETTAIRPDDKTGQAAEAALAARIKAGKPDPRIHAALLHQLDAIQKTSGLDRSAMSGPAAQSSLLMNIRLKQFMRTWGHMSSVAFRHVGAGGADIYDVGFEHARTQWRVWPLDPDGKIRIWSVRFLEQQP